MLTDGALSVLAANCPRLQALLLGHCELITDEGLRQLLSAQLEQLQDLGMALVCTLSIYTLLFHYSQPWTIVLL